MQWGYGEANRGREGDIRLVRKKKEIRNAAVKVEKDFRCTQIE